MWQDKKRSFAMPCQEKPRLCHPCFGGCFESHHESLIIATAITISFSAHNRFDRRLYPRNNCALFLWLRCQRKKVRFYSGVNKIKEFCSLWLYFTIDDKLIYDINYLTTFDLNSNEFQYVWKIYPKVYMYYLQHFEDQ